MMGLRIMRVRLNVCRFGLRKLRLVLVFCWVVRLVLVSSRLFRFVKLNGLKVILYKVR